MSNCFPRLEVLAEEVDVVTFEGYEVISQIPFYHLEVLSSIHWDICSLISKKVKLHYAVESKREKMLVVIAIDKHAHQKGYAYRIQCAYPLFFMSSQSSLQRYYDISIVEACRRILTKYSLHNNLKVNRTCETKSKIRPYLRQLGSETDYQFFHRLLEEDELGYLINDEGDIVLFHSLFECNDSAPHKSEIHVKHLEKMKITPIGTSVYFESCDTQIEIGDKVEIKKREYWVSELNHYYDKHDLGYYNQVVLEDAKKGSERKPIERDYHYAVTDKRCEIGTSSYRLKERNTVSNNSDSYQATRLLPYLGREGNMVNFNLHNETKVLVSYLDHDLNRIVMVGVLPSESDLTLIAQDTNKSSVWQSRNAGALIFDDSKKASHLAIGDNFNCLRLNTDGDVTAQTKGILALNAKVDSQISTGEFRLHSEKNIKMLAKEGFLCRVQKGHLSFDAKEKVRCQVKDNYTINTKNDLIINAKKLDIFGDRASCISEYDDIRAQSHLGLCELKGESINLRAYIKGEIGTDKAFFSLDNEKLKIKGVVISQPIKLLGNVIQTPGKPILPHFIPKSEYPNRHIPRYYYRFPINVLFLAWIKPTYQLGEEVQLQFLIQNVSTVLPGTVEIYQCVVKKKAYIDMYSTLEKSDKESLQLIDQIHFETSIEEQSNINLDWKPKNIRKMEGVCYFRFRVILNHITYPGYSNPMQLYQTLQVCCTGHYEASSLLVERSIENYLYEASEKVLKKVERNRCDFDGLVLGDNLKVFALDESNRILEVISGEKEAVSYCVIHEMSAEKNIESLSLGIMPPPFILNLRKKEDDSNISMRALKYFSQHTKSITFFIHGYNLPFGQFDKYPGTAFLRTVKSSKKARKNLHGWLIGMEDNLNAGNGFNGDYRDFCRCVFVAWSGQPDSAMNYYSAVIESQKTGARLAKQISHIRKTLPEIKINMIGHSLGCAVLVSALNHLSLEGDNALVDHAVLWQAAIPFNVFSKKGYEGLSTEDKAFYNSYIEKTKKSDRWYLPFAEQAVTKITVLYSKNDNVIGPILEKKNQPSPEKEKVIFNRKPISELITGVFFTYLGLESVYNIANQLGFPVMMMLDAEQIEMAWSMWTGTQKSASGKRLLKGTLSEQVALCQDRQILSVYCQSLSLRVKRNQKRILQIIDYINKRWTRYRIKWVYYFLKHIDIVERVLIEEQYANSTDTLLTMIERSLTTPMLRKELDHIYFLWIEPHLPLIKKIIVFINEAFYSPLRTKQIGMGWYGVDKGTLGVLSHKINNVDTTAWVYHHSDMFQPSPEIMKYIYKGVLMHPTEGLAFGLKK